MNFGMGRPAIRKEDQRFLTGSGRYTDDISVEGQAYAYVLRSPHAHADIGSINVRDALGAPGVLSVLTGTDAVADRLRDMPPLAKIPNRDGRDIYVPPYPVLATGRVRHVGNAVALVGLSLLYAGEILFTEARVLFNWVSIATIGFSAIFAQLLAMLFLNLGISYIGPSRAGVFFYLAPVFTAILAVVLLDEEVQIYHFIGIALVFGGVYLTSRER